MIDEQSTSPIERAMAAMASFKRRQGRPPPTEGPRACCAPLTLDPDGSPMFVYCQGIKNHLDKGDPNVKHYAMIEAWSDELGKLQATVQWRYP